MSPAQQKTQAAHHPAGSSSLRPGPGRARGAPSHLRALAIRALLFSILVTLSTLSHAQGCSLCRDTTAGSAPRARQGIRRAILVLGTPAILIFAGILFVGSRARPREE